MNTTRFTQQEIDNWKEYERVRAKGDYNMFDPNARYATGLSRADYGFAMDNYSELKTQAENTKTARVLKKLEIMQDGDEYLENGQWHPCVAEDFNEPVINGGYEKVRRP